jgi:WD40 repeat protein
MHTATLKRIAADRAGRFAVTAADDKTARVWDVASGGLLRVLRPPIAEGNEGKIFAVAITPDGETIAAAGWTGWKWHPSCNVYLFDRATGQIKQRLSGLPSTVNHLSFSPDGRWLAASLGGPHGVRVWDLSGAGKPPGQGRADAASYGSSWSADGRLAATSSDGRIRLYRAQPGGLAKLKEITATGGKQPYGIAFSPDGNELAVGYYDSSEVNILDGHQLIQKVAASNKGVASGGLENVAWSADGRRLYAGGKLRQDGRFSVRIWPDAGRGAPQDVPATGGAIMQFAPVPEGILVAGADPSWGLLDNTGQLNAKQAPSTANLSGNIADFRLSHDARLVQFDFGGRGDTIHRFSLRQRLLSAALNAAEAPGDEPKAPRVEGIDIREWQGSTTPTVSGRPIALDGKERSRSLAITPNGTVFVLGAEYSLRAYDSRGKPLWQRPTPGIVWGVNISGAGNVVAAAYGDGTIRWHRMNDGQELLAFFAHADRKRWVLWTPSGYYDASPGGEDLIGWHLNRGEDEAADFFPASRFRGRFLRPDIVDGVLDALDERKAIVRANESRATAPLMTGVAETLPPVVELISKPEVSTSQTRVTVSYRTRSDPTAPITALHVRVNGQAQPGARNLQPQATAGVRNVTVTVPAQDSQVDIIAANRHGLSTAATVRVRWVGGNAQPIEAPKLYLLAIGVSNYQHPDITKLSFAAKDAKDFAATMQRQQGKLYSKVEAKLVVEADATRDNIADALDWLQRQVTQRDVGMLFLSGHGYNDTVLGFTFLPVDADPDGLRRTGVTMADFKSALISLPGKTVAFLDACHSGNVFGPATKAPFVNADAAINDLISAEGGVVVFSSSTGRQLSLEDASWNNGAFTKALVEGIEGKAARAGRVTHKTLDVYVTERVKELTKGKQSPVTQAPGGVNDFPIAVMSK